MGHAGRHVCAGHDPIRADADVVAVTAVDDDDHLPVRRSEDSRRDRLKAEDARDRAVAAWAQLEEALRTRRAERGAAPPAEAPRSGATASAPMATVADQDRS
jgi:hypothetical protein